MRKFIYTISPGKLFSRIFRQINSIVAGKSVNPTMRPKTVRTPDGFATTVANWGVTRRKNVLLNLCPFPNGARFPSTSTSTSGRVEKPDKSRIR